MDRVILHCDLNNFYATVECKDHPAYFKVPMAVCGSEDDRHGIVLAKNEIAKGYGIRTTQTAWEAKKLCPNLVLVRPHPEKYLKYSKLVRDIYCQYTDMVESFSIDECWLDVTGSRALFGDGEQIAYKIKEQVKRELGLTLSIGVSYNKIFAKIASDLKKPDAVSAVTRETYQQIIWKLPVEAMLGVGRATKAKLSKIGVFTIGEMAAAPEEILRNSFGKNGVTLKRYALGLDLEPVQNSEYHQMPKSIGRSTTLIEDTIENDEVWMILLALSEDVAKSLRKYKLNTTLVQISVRANDLEWVEFQKKLDRSVRNSTDIARCAMELFKEHYLWPKPVRALGVRAAGLVDMQTGLQMSLYQDIQKGAKLDLLEERIDQIRMYHGEDKIKRARLLLEKKIPHAKENEIFSSFKPKE